MHHGAPAWAIAADLRNDVEQWFHGPMLQEWLKKGSHLTGGKGARRPHRAPRRQPWPILRFIWIKACEVGDAHEELQGRFRSLLFSEAEYGVPLSATSGEAVHDGIGRVRPTLEDGRNLLDHRHIKVWGSSAASSSGVVQPQQRTDCTAFTPRQVQHSRLAPGDGCSPHSLAAIPLGSLRNSCGPCSPQGARRVALGTSGVRPPVPLRSARVGSVGVSRCIVGLAPPGQGVARELSVGLAPCPCSCWLSGRGA